MISALAPYAPTDITANDLAKAGDIRIDLIIALCPAKTFTKTGHYFIKNKKDVRFKGDFSEFLEEIIFR
jgi:hypothetical protein